MDTVSRNRAFANRLISRGAGTGGIAGFHDGVRGHRRGFVFRAEGHSHHLHRNSLELAGLALARHFLETDALAFAQFFDVLGDAPDVTKHIGAAGIRDHKAKAAAQSYRLRYNVSAGATPQRRSRY